MEGKQKPERETGDIIMLEGCSRLLNLTNLIQDHGNFSTKNAKEVKSDIM
jgi:hypothetical protein